MVGWAHSRFGRLDGLDLETPIGGVARAAIADAGIDAGEVDGIWLGQLNGGFVPEIFASSLVLQADDALRWSPATRRERLRVGRGRAVCGLRRRRIRPRADGPWAQPCKDLGFEFSNMASEHSLMVAAPLRKTDCSPVSDGAAAVVLVNDAAVARFARAVRLRARAQVSDYLPMSRRDAASFEGPRRAWAQALATPGQGARLPAGGVVDAGGRLPVNPSGGLKANGHPIVATGVSMHVLAAMQLLGEAGEMQVPVAELAGVFNMGGSAVASHVSILERAK